FLFFVINLLGFSFLLKDNASQIAPIFFSWVSIFNLTTISLFWTVLADSCSEAKAKLLFGPIAAGGSIGAFLGPVITSQFVRLIHPHGIVVLSATLLLFSVLVIKLIPRIGIQSEAKLEAKVSGGVLAGLKGIANSPF